MLQSKWHLASILLRPCTSRNKSHHARLCVNWCHCHRFCHKILLISCWQCYCSGINKTLSCEAYLCWLRISLPSLVSDLSLMSKSHTVSQTVTLYKIKKVNKNWTTLLFVVRRHLHQYIICDLFSWKESILLLMIHRHSTKVHKMQLNVIFESSPNLKR